MTSLFFVISLIFGWLAWNLYRPIHRPGPNIASFLCGWLTGELVLHHVAWQVILVALFVWSGAVHGLPGALGFIICVLAWLAMGHFFVASHKARSDMEQALTTAFGTGAYSRLPDTLNYSAIAMPVGNLDRQVELIRDVPYCPHDQTLDIYRSRKDVQGRPVLMQIHGGAWTEKLGSKHHQAIPLMNHMALGGWICVANSYRLSPGATFPEHLIDCKEALVWIKEHIQEYGGNPEFIVVTGGSAGGHLSALTALTENQPEFQPGFEDRDTSVQGAVPFYGVYDFIRTSERGGRSRTQRFLERSIMKKSLTEHMDDYKKASPLFQIHENAPPFFIIHGNKDSLVPVAGARNFADKLSKISRNPVVYAEISGGQHAFDMFPSVRSEHVKHGVERFLTYLYDRYNS